ncbi:ArsR family transcriptional regulator [Halorubellus sp. JP-L1]|uniref:DUF7344 domain-containing protein n=1 Tax=Halorubellus sp. JP-L1 TaxID=2715753 RepID=UPI0014095BCB|nr:ArsR family transcriptional regulator [Halorubellus sp. JP-L1]NHN43156.1 ArsR family transcriptional regulator [Halorubellus sp. JP-L1]
MTRDGHRSDSPDDVARTERDRDAEYRALAETNRRRVLRYLRNVEDGSTLQDLATVLAGWESTESDRVVSNDRRRELMVALHHVHLPVLADAGLLSYDSNDGTVALESIPDAVEEALADEETSQTDPGA